MTKASRVATVALAVFMIIICAGCAAKVDYELSREFTVVESRDVAVVRVAWPDGRWRGEDRQRARDISALFRAMTVERLENLNYGVVPVGAVDERIDSAGLDMVRATPTAVAKAAGADSVLYINVTKWDVDSLLTYRSLAIEAVFELYSATGVRLWRAEYATSESDIGLDEDRVRLTVEEIYEPRVQRFVDAVMATLPQNSYEAPPRRYFDWLN